MVAMGTKETAKVRQYILPPNSTGGYCHWERCLPTLRVRHTGLKRWYHRSRDLEVAY